MPPEEEILKQIKIPKIPNQYQDANKNEVNFRVKSPEDMENENKYKKRKYW